jgi:hypothetical protein
MLMPTPRRALDLRLPSHFAAGSNSSWPSARNSALAFGFSFFVVSTDAGAAAAQAAAPAFGALAFVGMLLLQKQWPFALTASLWVGGTLLALALWLLRGRWTPHEIPSGHRKHAHRRDAPRREPAERPTRSTGIFSAGPVAVGGVDPAEVLAAAKRCFVTLQAAWDAGDTAKIRLLTTDQMLDELLQELPINRVEPNQTDVLTLDAELLGLERVGVDLVASVEFSGIIRESDDVGPAPFKELWMLTCRQDETPAWRLARHQALL